MRDAKGQRRLAVLLDTEETTFLVWFNPNQLDDMMPQEVDSTAPEDWDDDLPEDNGEYPEE